mgnify:CR=1 FL=1
MIAIAESVDSRAHSSRSSSVDRPPLLPEDWDPLEPHDLKAAARTSRFRPSP